VTVRQQPRQHAECCKGINERAAAVHVAGRSAAHLGCVISAMRHVFELPCMQAGNTVMHSCASLLVSRL